VISDFNMPNLDGLALLRAIRARTRRSSQTAFVMLTGRADRELVQRAVQFGVNNYLRQALHRSGQLKEKLEQVVFGPTDMIAREAVQHRRRIRRDQAFTSPRAKASCDV
jgi:two-component system chemotaxis response regulator CheY